MTEPKLRVEVMGRVPYGRMFALQKQRHNDVVAGAEDTLFLLEHDPVVTLGKNRGGEHVLYSPQLLAAKGIELAETDRGGDVTFHGPGQIVGYPIVKLRGAEQDVKKYVFRLEEILIRTAADFGVTAERVEGLRGIWVGNNKLAAIGVRIAQWVTLHGFALNVNNELSAFDCIVPCGLHGRGVTSLSALSGRSLDLHEVHQRLAFHAGHVLARAVSWAAASPLPPAAFKPSLSAGMTP